MQKIFLNVFGIRVCITTALDDFAEFVRQNYHCFQGNSESNPDVEVLFSEEAGDRSCIDAGIQYDAGMGIKIGKQKLYWENEYGYRTLVTLKEGGGYSILAFHYDIFREQEIEKRYQNFQRSMRWCIHFPIFVLLQERLGWRLIHASAVVKNGKALVFCGLNKVGKSTLAMYLCKRDHFSFMTDNFLFVSQKMVYGFPEVLRVSPETMSRLGLQSTLDYRVYGKHHVPLDSVGICLKAQPIIFFLLTVGKKHNLAEVEPSQALGMVDGISAFLREFPESSYLSMLPFIKNEPVINHSSLSIIRDDVKWYHLSFPMDWNLEKVSEVIKECT